MNMFLQPHPKFRSRPRPGPTEPGKIPSGLAITRWLTPDRPFAKINGLKKEKATSTP